MIKGHRLENWDGVFMTCQLFPHMYKLYIDLVVIDLGMDVPSVGRAGRGLKEKERGARSFQKLPPPFELNEHHNMHKSLKIPIAIYEKEPTSLIAYALSSREYAQEYWAMVDRRHNTAQPEKLHVSTPSSPKL